MSCIEVNGITKHYGSVCALNNVSLRFEENKIYGLLGRNGAGKTTLLNIITGRIFADGGEVMIDGAPAPENDEAQQKVFFMSEATLYPEGMKIRDVFKWTKMFRPAFDLSYAESLARQFELNTEKRVKGLSTGFTSIFKLITALASNAPFLLFDEPVLGLDANNRDLFYRLLIEKYSDSPCTIIISTHLIEEVSNVIEDIVIIKNGSIIKNEPREELLRQGYSVSGPAQKIEAYIAGKAVIGVDSLGGLKTACILGAAPQELPEGIEISRLDLQRLFIQLTNS
jgi:ABC-2 type transport system ATP-binding protein